MSDTATRLLRSYAAKLTAADPGNARVETSARAAPDLSDGGIKGRVDASRAELHRIVRNELGDAPDLHDIVDRLSSGNDTALRVLRDDDTDRVAADPDVLSSLEVIVRTDGSRPSFMVRHGAPDLATSPAGMWREHFEAIDDALRRAIACVGRVDDPDRDFAPQGFCGTGFLIADNLIATNLHVLQAIGRKPAGGAWTLRPDITIDFGHEFRARSSVGSRALGRVLFAGDRPIVPEAIDHAKLDLALIELEPAPPTARPESVLALDIAPDWAQRQTMVCVVGYPGNPGLGGNAPQLLAELFKSTFGHKRLAPGEVSAVGDELSDSPRDWTIAHDSTTLGGNSGSAMLVLGRTQAAAAIHYGGRRAGSARPAENWAHLFGLALDDRDELTGTTLRQVLEDHDVQLSDFALR